MDWNTITLIASIIFIALWLFLPAEFAYAGSVCLWFGIAITVVKAAHLILSIAYYLITKDKD